MSIFVVSNQEIKKKVFQCCHGEIYWGIEPKLRFDNSVRYGLDFLRKKNENKNKTYTFIIFSTMYGESKEKYT